MFHNSNPRVQGARNQENYAELSRLGKKGAEARKRKKERKLARLLADVQEKLAQGNEDWCPVD